MSPGRKHDAWKPGRRQPGMAASLLLLCLALAFCLFCRHSNAGEVVDMVGRRLVISGSPGRIVALAPSLTEIVFSLGVEEKLVGVTTFSDFPAPARMLPKVGSYVHPDLERIVALEPDLCLAIKDGNPKAAVDRLVNLGIPVYAVNPRNLDGVMQTMLEIGRILGAEERASLLVSDMKRRIRSVEEKLARIREKPRVFFQIGITPIVSVGRGTFADELIALAGGVNVARGSVSYPRFSVEQVIGLKPDIIIISSMDRGRIFEDVKAGWKKWKGIPAVAENRVVLVDSNLFDRPTPRLVDGLRVMAEILHPELFHGDY